MGYTHMVQAKRRGPRPTAYACFLAWAWPLAYAMYFWAPAFYE